MAAAAGWRSVVARSVVARCVVGVLFHILCRLYIRPGSWRKVHGTGIESRIVVMRRGSRRNEMGRVDDVGSLPRHRRERLEQVGFGWIVQQELGRRFVR